MHHSTTVIQNHYYSPGYGGGYYHPWYHPVFVWPTYGNYTGGQVGGVEQLLLAILVIALVGGIGYTGWKVFGK